MLERKQIIELLKDLDIQTSDDSYDIRKKLNDLGYHRDQVSVADGASKICLIFKDKPFVIKWSTYGYSEAMKEVEVYKKAIEKNLEKFFPKTAFLFSIFGIDFVAQEKIDFSVSNCSFKTDKKYHRISRTALDSTVARMEKEFYKASPLCKRRLDRTWAKMAIVLYGKKACKALCNFIIENKINDLHGDNIGYKNNKPIIIDFSGYDR